jgi:hypothetical protein
MKFDADDGKNVTVTLAHCKDGLTAQKVLGAMETMIENQIFTFGLNGALGARVTERTVTELF